MRVQKTPEGDKRQLILLFDGVAVGDYHAVALIPVAFVWDRALNVVTPADRCYQIPAQDIEVLIRVNDGKMFLNPPQKVLFVCLSLLLHVGQGVNSAWSSSTAVFICSRISGMALMTLFQLGMKGVSMGLSRNCSPAAMMLPANISIEASSVWRS